MSPQSIKPVPLPTDIFMGSEAEHLVESSGEVHIAPHAAKGIIFELIRGTRSMLKSPAAFWDAERLRPVSSAGVYRQALLPLTLLLTVTGIIGEASFFGAHLSVVLRNLIYGLTLLGLAYLHAAIIERLAPYFKAAVTHGDALRLLAYSGAPAIAVASSAFVCSPISKHLALALFAVSAVAALYALYALYVGMGKLTTVPEERHAGFFGACIAVILVATLAIVPIVDSLVPPFPAP